MDNKKFMYQINIGKKFNISEGKIEYDRTIPITNDQYDTIKLFANTKKDKDLNTTYILNDCEFTVTPYFDMDKLKRDVSLMTHLLKDIRIQFPPFKIWEE